MDVAEREIDPLNAGPLCAAMGATRMTAASSALAAFRMSKLSFRWEVQEA